MPYLLSIVLFELDSVWDENLCVFGACLSALYSEPVCPTARACGKRPEGVERGGWVAIIANGLIFRGCVVPGSDNTGSLRIVRGRQPRH